MHHFRCDPFLDVIIAETCGANLKFWTIGNRQKGGIPAMNPLMGMILAESQAGNVVGSTFDVPLATKPGYLGSQALMPSFLGSL